MRANRLVLAQRRDARQQLLKLGAVAPRAIKLVSRPARVFCQSSYDALPPAVVCREPFLSLGRLIQRGACRREQNTSTCFLRNRAEFELLAKLAAGMSDRSELKLTVLGCSTGAEAYSAIWSIQSARPELQLRAFGIDIEASVLEAAKSCEYLEGSTALHRLTDSELERHFERTRTGYRVRESIRAPIRWLRADVRTDEVLQQIGGPQDIVLANRFLCHMEADAAEETLRRIIALVRPGGYLFVSGVDADVRTRVAMEHSLEPLIEENEAVYSGDPSLVAGWPTRYWGIEPFNRNVKNWEYRYAPVFQVPTS